MHLRPMINAAAVASHGFHDAAWPLHACRSAFQNMNTKLPTMAGGQGNSINTHIGGDFQLRNGGENQGHSLNVSGL